MSMALRYFNLYTIYGECGTVATGKTSWSMQLFGGKYSINSCSVVANKYL